MLSKLRNELPQGLAVVSVAIVLRYWHLVGRGFDYYGDSYHHWLVSYLTARNGYAYTGFHSPQYALTNVWLPLYHYLAALTMNVTGDYYISTLHAINIVLGAITCLATAFLTRLASGNRVLGLVAGLTLAIQPWYVDLNTLALTETLATAFLLLSAYAFLTGRERWFVLLISLGMLTRYELWFFAGIFLLAGGVWRRWSRKTMVLYALPMLAIASGWSLWTYQQSGHPLGWYGLEHSMITWDIRYFYGHNQWNPSRLATMGIIETASGALTFWAGLIGSLFLIVRGNGPPRILALLYLSYFALVNLQVLSGASLPEPKYLSDAFPLSIIVSLVAIIARKPRAIVRYAKVMLLMMLVLLPLNQTWINFPALPPLGVFAFKTYVVEPERDAGLWLQTNYGGGRILCDSPTVIYYGYPRVSVGSYVPSDQLHWYANSKWSKPMLTRWIEDNQVRYVVWQNTSFSATWWMFPELRDRGVHVLGPLTFKPVYDATRTYRDKTIVVVVYAIEGLPLRR